MPGHSDNAGGRFDALAKAVCTEGISRRALAKLAGGVALTAIFPPWARAAGGAPSARGGAPSARVRRARPAIKPSGHCAAPPTADTAPYYKGVCGGDLYLIVDKKGIVRGCKGKWIPAGLGIASTFNGCGPEGGIDVWVIGRGDYVPDRPFGLVNFFDPCKHHDCCYGSCTNSKSNCDGNFLSDMVQACHETYLSAKYLNDYVDYAYCLSIASAYFDAVSYTQTGKDAYDAAKIPECACCITCEQYGAMDGVANPSNYRYCGDAEFGGCTDVSTDEENCGSCGNVCGSDGSNNTACCGGECRTDYACMNY